MPYAFEGGEAEKLAGHSASEFVTTDSLQSAVQQQLQQQPIASSSSPATAGSGNSAKAASKKAAADGPTNFSGSTSDQIVGVTQGGTGAGVNSSAGSDAILGMATAAGGLGVHGRAYGAGGTAVWGSALSTTGAGVGIRGYAASPAGTAGVFQNAGGGMVLLGLTAGGAPAFNVDGKGNVVASGTTRGN